MKEIIKSSDFNVIEFKNFVYNRDDIVAYETKSKNGLAILVRLSFSPNNFGFIYHSDLIKCKFDRAKFISPSALNSIEDVLNCGRTVFIFDSFKEFCKYSTKFVY